MHRLLLTLLALLAAVGPAALRADETPAQWNFKTDKANEAVRKYRAVREKLDGALEKNRGENRAALIEKLDAALKETTKAGDLDQAVAIRDAIKVLRNPPGAERPAVDTSGEEPAEPTVSDSNHGKKPGKSQTPPSWLRPHVISTWNHEGHIALRFFSDGKFDTSDHHIGTWSLVGNSLTLRWDHGFVDKLTVAEDGRSYAGRSSGGVGISGNLVSGKTFKAEGDKKE